MMVRCPVCGVLSGAAVAHACSKVQPVKLRRGTSADAGYLAGLVDGKNGRQCDPSGRWRTEQTGRYDAEYPAYVASYERAFADGSVIYRSFLRIRNGITSGSTGGAS